MPSIEIDPDVYEHLLKNTSEIGESASSILRRLLRITPKAMATRGDLSVRPDARTSGNDDDPLGLEREALLTSRNATDRYLLILGGAYRHSPAEFTKVLSVRGRTRKYFGRSEAEIEGSGQATHPRPIPDSPYWAMTNASTSDKRDILRQVLEILGHQPGTVRSAIGLLE